MSRVIIKNLPKKITEDELKTHFSPDVVKEITDCKLKYDANGNFRGFAFVGFKGNDTASRVINSYNKSYITTSRIIVENYEENATSIKTKLLGKRDDNSKRNIIKEENIKDQINPFKELESDPKFQEFLKVQRNIEVKTNESKGNYIWSDDVRNDGEVSGNQELLCTSTDPIDQASSDKNKLKLEKKKEKRKKKQAEKKKEKLTAETNEVKAKFQIKLMKLPCKVKKNQIKEFFSPVIPSKIVALGAGKGIAYVNFESESDLKKALLKHKSFLDGKQIDIKDVTGKLLDQSNSTCSGDNASSKKKDYKEPTESIADTSRLYIRNLSYTVQSEDIEELFKPFGELSEVYLPIDSSSKKPKGFAFVSFLFPEHAVKALETLDKTIFQGRLLHIIPGQSKPNNVQQFNQLSSFKQLKQINDAKDAEKPSNWNALFLGANAAAGVMAKRYDVSKTQLLADTNASDSIAVRMALGETQIVNETKAFLVENGIDLDSFNDPLSTNSELDDPVAKKKRKRSKTTILVKNLPPETKREEIESLFTRYGTPNRVLLPPYGVTAIVEMQDVSEAKKAFQKLSVFKFKHVPLYLEWAPVNVFKSDNANDALKANEIELKTDVEDQCSVSTDEAGSDGSTLFVKNLNFDTTDESLRAHFEKCGELISAKVSRRKGTAKDGKPMLLSMGFGFVVYKKMKDAEKGLRDLQNSLLDGHRLHVARSRSVGATPVVTSGSQKQVSSLQDTSKTTTINGTCENKLQPTETESMLNENQVENLSKKKKKITSNKILVRNVPFEATQKEVQELFRAFGGLKSVRLPKKLTGTGTHRGFGFVEFNTCHEAEKAFESLSGSTHLYGRRLVLEWAAGSSQEENEERKRKEGEINPGSYDSSFPGDEHIPRRQKSSVTGSKNKRLKKSDLVTRLEVTELEEP